MRLWTFGLTVAVGVVGCTGGPGEPFAGTSSGSSSQSSGFDQTGGSSGTTPGSSGSNTSSSSSSGTTSSGGTSTLIRAADFDQSCQTASDCTAIFQGDACSSCICPNAAIASSALSNYQSKLTSARASCGPTTAGPCPASCPNATPLCAGGKCSVAIGIIVDAGG